MKRLWISSLICILVLSFSLFAAAQDDWTMVWHDEFDGTEIDPAKWTFDIGNGFWGDSDARTDWVAGWGNSELEYYRRENASVVDGKLVITAKQETFTGEAGGSMQTFQYTSAKLKTNGLFSQRYGKFEARIKLPLGKGLWPAFWMLPDSEINALGVYGPWAASGEIDIMESWGSRPDVVAGTLHYGEQWPNNTFSGDEYTFPAGTTTNDFHVYGIEWEPGEIRWYVDGQLYQTQNNWYSQGADESAPFAYPAPFDQPFMMILNLAVGGHFDGNPDATTPFPSTMEVDYVRVYELTGRPYREAGERPVSEPAPDPDGYRAPLADGNYVYNNNFDQDLAGVDGVTGVPNSDYWMFLHLPDFGGDGTLAIEDIGGENFARIDVSAVGSQPYSIQLIQQLPVVQGNWYKASFDAKAGGNRSIQVKINGGESRGWTGYSEVYAVDLTDTLTHYEYVFQMMQESDPEARFEFNVGLNNQSVWIGNVRLEKTEAPAEDPDADKAPLGSGELVYNGRFDLGDSTRMLYWNFAVTGATATAQVPEATRELDIAIADAGLSPDAVTLSQKGLLIEKAGEYELTFDARAVGNRTVEVEVLSRDGSASYSGVQTIDVTPAMTAKSATFTMEAATDSGAQLVFKLGGDASDVVLDNVSMKKIGDGVDYSGSALFPLTNGSFDAGTTGWDLWTGNEYGFGGIAGMTADSGELTVTVEEAGNETWSIQLMQGPIELTQGLVYTVSFDACSTLARQIEVLAENADYYRYFSEVVDLTNDVQHYSYEFTMEADDTVTFKVLSGNVGGANTLGAHDIVIDNVKLEVVSVGTNGNFADGLAPWTVWYADWEIAEAPVATVTDEVLQVAMTQIGSQSWSIQVFQDGLEFVQGDVYTVIFDARAEQPRKLNLAVGKPLDADPWFTPYVDLQTYDLGTEMQRYSVSFTMQEASSTEGKLVFELGNIAGGNAVTPVYIDNVAILREAGSVPPVDPQALISNGDFENGTNDWGFWTGDQYGFGGTAGISVQDGVLETSVTNAGNETWSIQLTQGPITLLQDSVYQVSFDACASIVRNLEVLLENSSYNRYFSEELELSTSMQHYEYQFAMDATDVVTFKFLLGDVAGAGSLDSHSVFIDNVNLSLVQDPGGEQPTDPSAVPEPGTAVMVGAGVIALVTVIRRKSYR